MEYVIRLGRSVLAYLCMGDRGLGVRDGNGELFGKSVSPSRTKRLTCMSERLTRNDFVKTGVVLALMIVGVPCLMWAISSYRQQSRREAIERALPGVVERHRSLLEESARTIVAHTSSTSLSAPGTYYAPFWDELMRQNGVSALMVDEVRGAVRKTCTALKGEVERRLSDVVINNYDCSFFFKNQQTLVQGHPDQLYTRPEQEKTERVNALSSLMKPVFYPNGRDWLMYVLIQQEPRVALEMRLRDQDYSGY